MSSNRPRNPNEPIGNSDPLAPNDFTAQDQGAFNYPADKNGAEPKSAQGLALLTEEELAEWKKKIEAGIEYQKADGRWDRWNENLNYLNCRWESIHWQKPDQDHWNVNSIFSNLQAEVPSLYFQQPDVTCNATKPTFKRQLANGTTIDVDNLQAAKLLGIRVNQIYGDTPIEPTIARGIVDCKAPYGHCWWKVGYGLLTEFKPDLNQEVTTTTYWVCRVDPRNVVVDPLAPAMNMREWTAERCIREKKRLKKNPLYLQDKVELMPEVIPDVIKSKLEKFSSSWQPKLVEYWEVHEHIEKTVRWISINGTPAEVRPPAKRQDWVEGSDYEHLELNLGTDDSVYALSDIEPVLDQAIARNLILTSQVNHIMTWGITVFCEGEFWANDQDPNKWLTVGNNVTVCQVKQGALSQNKMTVVQPPPIPADWFNMDRILKGQNDETLAITAAQQGQVTGGTKAEVMKVSQESNVRVSMQRRKIKLALVNITKKLASLVRAHDDEKTIIDLSGYESDQEFMGFLRDNFDYKGAAPFLEVDKSAWQGEYNFDFEIEEMLDRPKAVQVAQMVSTWKDLGTIPQFAAVLDEEADARFALNWILEKQGMRLDSLKNPPSKAQMPPEFENQMAEQGIEIPPPHDKDMDDQHIFTHLSRRMEMQKALPKLQVGAVKGDMEALQAYEELKLAIRVLEEHVVMHNLKKRKKEKRLASLKMADQAMASGMPQGPRPVNGPQVMAGAVPPQPAAPPTAEGIAQATGTMPPTTGA